MKFFRPLLISVLILLTSSPLISTAQASDPNSVGSVGIRIAQIPAAIAEDPFAEVYIVSRLQPGKNLEQRLEVFNTSSQEFKVSVYPGAATFIDGKFAVADGKTGNTLTSWTKLSPNLLIVKPGESKTFVMNITTPRDAASIQQFGVIWAEVQGVPSPSGVTSVSRVGIRMYVPVGNLPAITISKASLASNTHQIIVKKSAVRNYLDQIIYVLAALNILFFTLFLIYFRRNSSERKVKKKRDKQDEAEWRKEKERRDEMSKRTER